MKRLIYRTWPLFAWLLIVYIMIFFLVRAQHRNQTPDPCELRHEALATKGEK